MGQVDFLNKESIVRGLEDLSCSVHGNHPDVKFVGDVMSVKCCCSEFHTQVNEQAEQLIQQESENVIRNMMQGFSQK